LAEPKTVKDRDVDPPDKNDNTPDERHTEQCEAKRFVQAGTSAMQLKQCGAHFNTLGARQAAL
jgi:hypothetical protein